MKTASNWDVIGNLIGIGVTICILGVGMYVYELYIYLRSGIWSELSVITVLQRLRVQWALQPDDWLGVHKYLSQFPLSGAINICGFIPLGVGLWLMKQL